MNVGLQEQCAKPIPAAPEGQSPGCLFVSSTLLTWATANPEWFARDFQINDTVYRRLDPEYYAWLRSRMVLAKKAATAGQLDAAAFEELRVRFNAVHEWAVEHFGEEQLLQAVRSLRAAEYRPPVAEDDRPTCRCRGVRKSGGDHISPDAVALVDGIAESAVAIGWKRERLYGIGSGVFDPRRGLVCYLKAGDRIGEVTQQSIEIIHPLPVGGAPPLLQPRCRRSRGSAETATHPFDPNKNCTCWRPREYLLPEATICSDDRRQAHDPMDRFQPLLAGIPALPPGPTPEPCAKTLGSKTRFPGLDSRRATAPSVLWRRVERSGSNPVSRSGLSSRTTGTALRRPRQKRRAIGMSGRRTPAWRNSLSWRTCP